MASRFWVGGTGTWDASDTTHWAASSGGAGGQSVPGSGDTVTFDGSSGGGTVTPNTTINVTSITAGAFTGTLAFNTNNNDVTVQTCSFSGSGTRTINMGSGTWTVTGGSGTIWDVGTATNLTPTFSNAALVFNASSVSRTITMGGQTYGAVTISNNATKGYVIFSAGGATMASWTIGSGNSVAPSQSSTTTVSGALTISGTSSAPSALQSSLPASNVATVSVGSASTADWAAFLRITKSGAGSITATNSFDLGGNTSITITAPSVGGGGGQRVFGG